MTGFNNPMNYMKGITRPQKCTSLSKSKIPNVFFCDCEYVIINRKVIRSRYTNAL